MPIAEIKMLAGRDKKTKKELIFKLTKTIEETLKVDPKKIRVILTEIPLENYGISGVSMAEYQVQNDQT